MRRETCRPRPDWRERVEHFGFDFHTFDGEPYWVEGGFSRFEAGEVDRIEDAANALHALCLEAVDHVCRRGEFDRVGLDGTAAALAEASWRRGDKALLGRMDLAYDGVGEPRLLEYNADTPTSLLEASVIQWYWLEDTRAGADQLNRIHEALVARWPQVASRDAAVHFAGALASDEDRGTLDYLRRTCEEAGLDTDLLDVSQVGLVLGEFVDMRDRPIRQLAKLYPWEWLLGEEFGAAIAASSTRWIEPAWKQVLSNKRVLPLLWDLFPGHPNLLPASLDPSKLQGPVVRKPQFGREGEGVSLHAGAAGLQAEPGQVFQQRAPLFHSGSGHALVGAWVVGDEAVGMGLREDDDAVTRNTSRFVPHCFD
jgi:glutathionylspermidine synthase